MALTRRISVNRETAAPSTRASRDPARPASASATRSSRSRSPAVRRWCLAVSPSTCSANVAAGQAGLSQMRRRTPRPGPDRPPAAARSCRAAPVPVVHPRRQYPAVTAGHRPGAGAGYDLHAAVQVLHAIEVQPAQMREQQGQQTGFPAGELVQHDDSLGRSS